MRTKGCKVSGWTCDVIPHPRQKDVTSCGVFVCKFAEQILRGEAVHFLNTDQAVDLIRKDMAEFLTQESEDLSNICCYCGEEDPSDPVLASEWIACDGCNRWFHQSCARNPPAEEEFYCSSCSAV
ncbi:hypothetical protein AMEX_G4583 [Astyanax mexicanus]|uniref:PHD-type domain-containing protein n=1 Tax=Astyanax mexicanus TaxID=7994 RepID=A0A8T2ME22_ASTMX|nr:hypothetical protein AMEX_G4583 [Astyanax mexicanus]